MPNNTARALPDAKEVSSGDVIAVKMEMITSGVSSRLIASNGDR
ncbi:MAG: hypothetical protein ACUVSL_18655 [Chloroflexus sp.]